MDQLILDLLSVETLRRVQVELAGHIEDLTRDFLVEVRSTGKGLEGGQGHLEILAMIQTETNVLVRVIRAIEAKEG